MSRTCLPTSKKERERVVLNAQKMTLKGGNPAKAEKKNSLQQNVPERSHFIYPLYLKLFKQPCLRWQLRSLPRRTSHHLPSLALPLVVSLRDDMFCRAARREETIFHRPRHLFCSNGLESRPYTIIRASRRRS